ncbi:hypothetical protein [Kordiimonas sp.]|uniref:hypothetical protein n=1 Tax=Kordiimonas sp. TaxID=1970157 RepID=UPI003A8FE13F|eukprot:TRINITY_DN7681_c0_g1_i1.p3 TRINITY_DN7681_c0_g1~~TRINITY_DN7681_c0_g1_i1.p3  ORF type:complete len:149 (-),score=37.83 TRINITY_DN7681_c0_g1_i1:16-462(-)
MNTLIRITAVAAAFALSACGDNEGDKKKADDMAAEVQTPSESSMDTATEAMTEVAEALKLDASSLDAFKESLASMKASLDEEKTAQLSSALATLAKKASGEGGESMMDNATNMAKNMGDGKSIADVLYEKLGDDLHGATFEDVLAMAN